MNAQEKVRVAIHGLLDSQELLDKLREELNSAVKLSQHRNDEVRRVLHSTLGAEKAASGVVFAGERWWLNIEGNLCREKFTAEVL